MSVTTVFATAPGGAGTAQGVNATYATARTTGASATGNHIVGQFVSSNYLCYESFLIFDTSGITDTDDISDVVLSLDGSNNDSDTDFTARVGASSYDGGGVGAGDYVSGALLSAITVLASWLSSAYDAGYNAFTSTGDFPAAINKTGNTSLIIWSNRHEDGTAPTGGERVTFIDADAAGTTEDGKLDITHTAGGGGTVVQDIIGTGIIAFAR